MNELIAKDSIKIENFIYEIRGKDILKEFLDKNCNC